MSLPFDPYQNVLLTLLVGTIGFLAACAVAGAGLFGLSTLITGFFKRSIPADATLAQFERASFVRATAKPKPITATSEPLVWSLVGFIVFFALGSIGLGGVKPVEHAPPATPTVARAGLTVDGDLTALVAALPPGNPVNGPKIFSAKACIGCHSLEKGVRLVGPSYYGLFARAGSRVAGQGAKEYIYQSVTQPNAFVVDTFQPGLMPQNFAQQLTPQQMADILAWMEKSFAQTD